MERIADVTKRSYRNLDAQVSLEIADQTAIRPDILLAFEYEFLEQEAEIQVVTEEFTAVCPWTGLPDLGTLKATYVPIEKLLELKSLKYYLLTYRSVGIAQENAAARILKDLAAAVLPKNMTVVLDYRVRGGIATTVTVRYP